MASETDTTTNPAQPLDTTHQAPPHIRSGGRVWALWGLIRAVTVEPILFCFIASWALQTSITTNLLLSKVCKEKMYDEVICANLSSHVEIQADVQKRVNTLNLYTNLITNMPGILFVLFLGSWSDRHGRKIPLLVPLFGSAIASLVLLVNAYWMNIPSLHILVAAVPRALTGGSSTFKTACYCYISDVSTVESRTARIAVLNGSFFMAAPAGFLASDILFYRTGYIGVYGVSLLLLIVAIVYTIIRIKNSHEMFSSLRNTQRLRNKCFDLFDTRHIKEVSTAIAKQRPNKGRLKLLLIIASICALTFNYGGSPLDYLYSKKMLGWDYHHYAQLMIISFIIEFLVSSVLLPLVSTRVRLDDLVLALVGCCLAITAFTIRSVASKDYLLYLSYIMACLGGLPCLTGQSFISKCVPIHELGKILSVLGSGEAIIPLIFSPLYTLLYNATILTFPGTIYIFTATLYLFTAVLYVWLYIERKRSSSAAPILTDRRSSKEALMDTGRRNYNTFSHDSEHPI